MYAHTDSSSFLVCDSFADLSSSGGTYPPTPIRRPPPYAADMSAGRSYTPHDPTLGLCASTLSAVFMCCVLV